MNDSFFIQLFGVQPCQVFINVKTKDFAERFLIACKVNIHYLDVHITNLALLVSLNVMQICLDATDLYDNALAAYICMDCTNLQG